MGVLRGARPAIASVQAVKHIRRMNGGSKAHMCACSDGQNYIVKFQNNAQGNRTLANDLLGTLLARYMGLRVPDPAIVEVTEDLMPAKRDRMLQIRPERQIDAGEMLRLQVFDATYAR